MTAKNNPSNNLFSTLMKPKKANAKHHHISCHQISTLIENNHKLSTLNLSAKHIVNNSPENLSADKTVSILKKDNKELLAKVKNQEKIINDINEQKKKFQVKYDASEKKRKRMKEEIEILKANETQLMTILYVLEENGIPIETILDKWNMENAPSKTNRSLDSAAFTPITLEKQPKYFTKIDNIPKLDFDNIKVNSLHRDNGEMDEDNNLKKKEVIHRSNSDCYLMPK